MSEAFATASIILQDLSKHFGSVKAVDGVSLVPVLKGGSIKDRPLFWHYPHYGNQGGAPGAAIRSGRWKLIEWYEDDSIELFDLKNDIGENNNLAKERPGLAATLHARLRAWLLSVNANMPSKNPGVAERP